MIPQKKCLFRMGYIFALIGLLLPITGCSVAMALTGKKDPNLGAIRVGSTRGEVELQLGSPTSSVTTEEGRRTDIYEYEIGNEPSAGRAVAHGVLDLLTWGLWEVVGTPVEAIQGKKCQMTITYDNNNCVAAINQPVVFQGTATEQVKSGTQQIKESSKIIETPNKQTEVEERLEQIKNLKDKDKITEIEYIQARKEILDNLSKGKEIPNKSNGGASIQTPY